MLKKLVILFSIIFCLINYWSIKYSFADSDYDSRVESSSTSDNNTNDHLDKIWTTDFVQTSTTVKWAEWIKSLVIRIARDVKNVVFAIAAIFFLVITIRLLFSSNSEEWFEKYKKWIIWITIWIIVMQMSYAFVINTFDKNASSLASSLINNIFIPIIQLLKFMALIFFVMISIYSFIRLVSSNWEKEKIKKGIDSIIYATIWIFLVKLSDIIIKAIYWNYSINGYWTYIIKIDWVSWFASLFIKFINWVTWFVAIITLLMIIYAWVNIIFSWWDDEKIKKGKSTIIYAFIWILILASSYLILTFFIWPEWSKILTP